MRYMPPLPRWGLITELVLLLGLIAALDAYFCDWIAFPGLAVIVSVVVVAFFIVDRVADPIHKYRLPPR